MTSQQEVNELRHGFYNHVLPSCARLMGDSSRRNRTLQQFRNDVSAMRKQAELPQIHEQLTWLSLVCLEDLDCVIRKWSLDKTPRVITKQEERAFKSALYSARKQRQKREALATEQRNQRRQARTRSKSRSRSRRRQSRHRRRRSSVPSASRSGSDDDNNSRSGSDDDSKSRSGSDRDDASDDGSDDDSAGSSSTVNTNVCQ